jgi:hypothetical protein
MNDNYQVLSQSMESVEAGSILAQRDYVKPSKRNHLRLIAVLCIGFATFLAVVFFATIRPRS